jgi:DNA-binding transcriptional regulator YiaG
LSTPSLATRWTWTHTRELPNIAAALKSEISRIARKEVKAEVLALRKSSASQRKEIAELKRRAQTLEQLLRRLGQAKAPPPSPAAANDETSGVHRFSAKGLLMHRKRLGLSAAEVGVLMGTSSQTIYNWEQGKSRPKASHLAAIAALRTLGKKQAAAIVASRMGAPEAIAA